MGARTRWLAIAAATAMLAQCSLLTSLDDLGGDASAPDGETEAASDAAPEATDAATGDGDAAPTATYHDMTDPKNWSLYDLADITPDVPYFDGTAFDGRYIYFAPENQTGASAGVVFRHDTQSPFDASASWERYGTADDAGEPVACGGALYAAPFMYLLPLITNCCGSGRINRYDTTKPFDASASWSSFDTTSIDPADNRFLGGTFDGRFVYFVPQISNLFTRYDTTAPFDAGSSFATFDVGTIDAGGQLLYTAIYDGRYVYVIPSVNFTAGSVVIRYDTQGAFTSGSSYATFDTSTFNAGAKGFSGGAFDGRYLYLVPGYDGTTDSGLVVRYDTQATFTSFASWDKFDATVLSPDARDFANGGFDGRYIYLVPNEDATSGVVVRYDTQSTFTLASSWQTFDTRTLDPRASVFSSVVFDGRYLYFEPGGDTVVARFDARSPPAMPPGFSGSFF